MKNIILLCFVLLVQGCGLPDKESNTPLEFFTQRDEAEQALLRSELQSNLQSLLIALTIPEEISVPLESFADYPLLEADISVDISHFKKKIYLIDGDAAVSSCYDGVMIATGMITVSSSNDCIFVSGSGIDVAFDDGSTFITDGYLDISHPDGSLVYYSAGSGLNDRDDVLDYSPLDDENASDIHSLFLSQVFSSTEGGSFF